MPIILDGTAGIDNDATDLSYTGTLTGGTGVVNLGSGQVYKDASGNVGIGTSSPTNRLSFGANIGRYFALYEGAAGADMYGIGTETSALTFKTAATERMRIDSSGRFMIGNADGTSADRLIAISAAGTQDTALIQNSNSSTFASNVLVLGATRNTDNSTFNFLTCVTQGIAFRLHIRDSGNVVNQNNSYGAISDAKLKENVTDATPKLEKLNQVRVVNFNMIGSDQKLLGVVAQELEQIFPGMVEESPDRDAEGNDLGTTTKAVKYSVFVPMLIKGLQELKAINDAQAQTIESLTARVVALEGQA